MLRRCKAPGPDTINRILHALHLRNVCETSKTSACIILGVLCGSVVKCLTRNPGVLGSSRTGSSGFFRGSVFRQDTSEPQPSSGDVNNVSCRRDMTEILLKAA